MNVCDKCGKCCRHPCAILKKDIKPLCIFLNVSEEELFHNFLVWDYWIGENSKGECKYYYYPTFARVGDETGKTVNDWWAFSNKPCIMLDSNNLCKVHLVKPSGGKNMFCKRTRNRNYKKLAAYEWKEPIFLK